MANRHCPIHTRYRHPRICKFCRAESGARDLAPSESQGELAVFTEAVSAEPPKPSRGARGKRNWRMQPRIAAVLVVSFVVGALVLFGRETLGGF